jgi:nicotinamidase-related amidase
MTKALVVIDVQKAMFADPALPPYEGEAVVARIRKLIERAREAGVRVFFVQHQGEGDDPLQPGLPGFPFHDALAPRPDDDVTVKRRSSAFHDTDLDAKLRQADVDHLVVTGMQSEFCVDSAVRGAVERGYAVTLVADAHSTFDSRVAKAAVIVAIQNDTLRGFGTVKKAEEVLF